jgi:hypothetical protein
MLGGCPAALRPRLPGRLFTARTKLQSCSRMPEGVRRPHPIGGLLTFGDGRVQELTGDRGPVVGRLTSVEATIVAAVPGAGRRPA